MAKQKKQDSEAVVRETRSNSSIDFEFDRLGLIPEHGIVILSGRRSDLGTAGAPVMSNGSA